MENNNLFNQPINPASQAQINYLKKLGYTGDTEGMTAQEANQLINEYRNKPQQAPNQYYQQQNATPANNAPIVAEDTSFNVITTRNGEELLLSKEVVNTYLTSQDSPLTDTEYKYFFSVCKTYGLNPFLKDIYPIKFGNQPATFVIDYKVLQMACENHPAYDGLKTGVLVVDAKGNFVERDGAYILPQETLIGAWCDVYRKDRNYHNRTYAMYSENLKTDKSGKVNSNWGNKPVFMITKVAKAQALRETFPNLLSNNTYTSDENLGELNDAIERRANAITITPKEAVESVEIQQSKAESKKKPTLNKQPQQAPQEDFDFNSYAD